MGSQARLYLLSRPMRNLVCMAALLLIVSACRSQSTLREQLQTAGIPVESFGKAQLDEVVDGAGASHGRFVSFVYLRTRGEELIGFPQVIRFDTGSGLLLTSEVRPTDQELCCGAPDGIDFVDDYLLLSFHYNPSASSVLVLDEKLKLVQTLYGFWIRRVAPNQVVMIENMVHFAPVHPERVRLVNLIDGKSLEIYPSKNDALRNQFDKDSQARMPSICTQRPELCDNDGFDEDCEFLGGDGNGKFAFECGRSASYQAKEGEESVTYASDDGIYLFEHKYNGWAYCERAVTADEAKMFQGFSYGKGEENRGYEIVKDRCIPNLAIVPDMSNDLSPFPAPTERK